MPLKKMPVALSNYFSFIFKYLPNERKQNEHLSQKAIPAQERYSINTDINDHCKENTSGHASTPESLLLHTILTCCGSSRSKQRGSGKSEQQQQGKHSVPRQTWERQPGYCKKRAGDSGTGNLDLSLCSTTFSPWGSDQITTSQDASFYL